MKPHENPSILLVLAALACAVTLRAAGYKTAYIGKWHLGDQHGQRPGFDYSVSFGGQGHYMDCPVEINGVSTPTKGWIDDVDTGFAIEWMKKNRDQPFSKRAASRMRSC